MSTNGIFNNPKKLGEGTYGRVYRATAVDSGRVLAFKRMMMTNAEDGVPATAIREIALLRELKHANVVDLLYVLFEPPKITLVFELCDYDLKQYIVSKNGAGLDLRTEVLPILKQMLMGLSFLHSKSVVHRDLKPQNVFLNIRPAYYYMSDGSGTYPCMTPASATQLSQHAATTTTTMTVNADATSRGGGCGGRVATVLMAACPAPPPDNDPVGECGRLVKHNKEGADGVAAAVPRSAGVVPTVATTKLPGVAASNISSASTSASVAPLLPLPAGPNPTSTAAVLGARAHTAALSSIMSCIIVKLGDFGLARVENIPVKKYSHEAVTLWYRSPDAIMGSALYSLAVDMWSVGAIFFEMVTGKVLLSGCNEEEQLYRIFRLLGSPTRETWPSMLTYPNTLERLQHMQKLVAKGHVSSSSSPNGNTSASGGGMVTSLTTNTTDVGVLARPQGYVDGDGCNTGTSSAEDAACLNASVVGRGVPRLRSTTRVVNTYNLPSDVWFSEARFDSIMSSSGFRNAVGDSGVDLLRCCLQYEPQHRITAEHALHHPFLSQVPTHDISTMTKHMDALAQSLKYTGL